MHTSSIFFLSSLLADSGLGACSWSYMAALTALPPFKVSLCVTFKSVRNSRVGWRDATHEVEEQDGERKDMVPTHVSEVRWNLHHVWDLFSYVLHVQFVVSGLAGCCCCCCCSVTVVPFNCVFFFGVFLTYFHWLQVYRWQVVCWWAKKNAETQHVEVIDAHIHTPDLI